MASDKTVRILVCTGGAWELVDGVLEYRPLGLRRRTIELELHDLTYTNLAYKVARKYNFPLNIKYSGFRMSYQVPCSLSNERTTVVVEVSDEEDARIFLDIARKKKDGMISLYVEPVPSV